MVTDILIMIAIALGGVWLFKTARRSRREYEQVYGGKTTKQKLRMSVIFVVILTLMLVIAFILPESRAFFIGGAILAGYLGAFSFSTRGGKRYFVFCITFLPRSRFCRGCCKCLVTSCCWRPSGRDAAFVGAPQMKRGRNYFFMSKGEQK